MASTLRTPRAGFSQVDELQGVAGILAPAEPGEVQDARSAQAHDLAASGAWPCSCDIASRDDAEVHGRALGI